ncbi:MAG: UDP-glucose 4-epimerase GalE [Acidobacteria bacterium]|uniref:UDP-glucose 4-epimerase n=1 Tax=Candidatus Polarisedimenticola svalbardensis TaxID=2886004 RepID=A0A8J6XT68_9BACT|nr:UDP-glucose 4-epimerase GalE [Candidatus Polarisedimenticola svalbardensis]
MQSVLVTGGAGYIGSHIVRRLQEDGHPVVVLDDLSEGHREAVPAGLLHVGDFADRDLVRTICRDHAVEYVVHMAANCQVGESVVNPSKYYRNNLVNSLAFLEVVREAGVKGLVFSSTAAVYGEPVQVPITEDHPTAPTNPYGETKLAFERALSWYRKAYGLRYVALRYFNAAGADPEGDIGEDHAHESHLVPLLIRAAMNPTSPLKVFGTDYPTADGTCVRDYVHVSDLAAAHVLALGAMDRGEVGGASFNLGNGEGFSVREVIRAVEQVVGQPVPVEDGPRRDGDPAVLVASSLRIREALGWDPRIADLPSIIRTAWNWHRRNPNGFNG